MKIIKTSCGTPLNIVTDNNGAEYVLIGFIRCGNYYLIPYNGSKYWEHHFVPKDKWIKVNKNFQFDNYSMTKDMFHKHLKKIEESIIRVTEKFKNSF